MNNALKNLTASQRVRVAQSIVETERLIAKEMAYSEAFRNNVWLAEYEAHLINLKAALASV